MAGIYIHIPFCKQSCHYCNFHFSTSMRLKEEMLLAISRELLLRKNEISEPVETIYFGGGTPSLLSVLEVEQLINTINKNYALADKIEMTFETNPDDVNKAYLNGLKSIGVNRLSLGVQSFSKSDLLYMNRAHNELEAKNSIDICLSTGFENLSVDFIYGTPTMSNEQWAENLDVAAELNVPHLSCYQLTVEEKTPLEALIKREKLLAPEDNVFHEQFEILMERAEKHGWSQYEISNFAMPGFESKHNSSYWKGISYLGIGPAAHSFDGEKRLWNIANNKKYIQEIFQDKLPLSIECLSDADRYNEFVMIALRLKEGITFEVLKNKFPQFVPHFLHNIKGAIKEQKVKNINDNFSLTGKGKMWCDQVSMELFVV